MDLTDIFRAFRPKPAEYTFLSSAYGISSRMYHILGHKQVSINLMELKSDEQPFTSYTGMKLELHEENW